MDTLKEIGAILGFVAFGGMAVLAFLTFQQARHLRRLRDWAGRAPERAEAQEIRDAEASAVAAEAEDPGAPPQPDEPGRFAVWREGMALRFEELGRRSPFDPRILVIALILVVVGVGVATSGFGLFGGDSEEPSQQASQSSQSQEPKVEVAVLNGTADEAGVAVPGIADRVSRDVKSAGYKIGEVENAGTPYPESVIMFIDGAKSDAKDLAADVEGLLGETQLEAMTPEIEEVAGSAELALIVGQDDQGI